MSLKVQLNKLQEQKTKLIEQEKLLVESRKNHIGSLAQKAKSLLLDDEHILGALIYAKNAFDKHDTATLKQLEELAKPFLSSKKKKS